jgi:hypothetical protein
VKTRTTAVACSVGCGRTIQPDERAFYDEGDDQYECLECAADRFSCDYCTERFPVSQAIVVPQPPPYQEQRYCSVKHAAAAEREMDQ